MTFYAPFCLPFIIGAAVMFATLLWKWGSWLYRLPRADKRLILRGLPTRRTLGAVWGGGAGLWRTTTTRRRWLTRRRCWMCGFCPCGRRFVC